MLAPSLMMVTPLSARMPTKRGLLPPAAHDMLARLVAPSPDDRPSSAQDVLDRLSQIRRRGMDIYAARAVIDDPPGQPVPLDGADRVVGVQDQPGQPVPRRASSVAWSRASRAQPAAWPSLEWTGRPPGQDR